MKWTFGQILQKYGSTYIQQYAVAAAHLKVIDAIRNCRTSGLGGHAWVCTSCGGVHVHFNSCGNRHCPQCQAFEKEKWVEKRKQELLPVPYLHLVFTIPHELNPLVLSNDRLMYNLLFKATWQTINKVAKDKRWLGAQTGMIAVLHTWGSNLSLHPHLHLIIPSGGLNKERTKWIGTKKKAFLAPNKKVLSPIFKAIFLKLLTKAFETDQLEFFGQAKLYEDITQLRQLFAVLQRKKWNVYAKKPFGGPAQILNYLSRYTHRVAISNHRIVGLKNNQLTFSVKDYKRKNDKGLPIIRNLTLNVLEFIRRFLLHVLPKGFQRIRYFGILAIRNRKTILKTVQALLNHQPPAISPLHWKERLEQLRGVHPDSCPFCGLKTLKELGFIPQQFIPIGRSPPINVQITTPEGEFIPITA